MSKDGQLVYCELHEWAEWFGKIENRVIGKYAILGLKVSTVFLGLNHKYFDEEPDQWFETMIFGPEYPYKLFGRKKTSVGHELYCARYATYEEALAGHAWAVGWLQERLDLSRAYQLCLPSWGEPSEVVSEVDELVPVAIADILAGLESGTFVSDHRRFFGSI